MDTVKILGIKFHNVNMDEAYKTCVNFINNDRIHTVFTPNPEMVMLAQENIDLKNALLDADLVIPDGIGIIYASNYLKLGLKERVPGIDLMSKLLNYANSTKRSVYFLGASNQSIELAVNNIKDKYKFIDIKGYHNGYFDKNEELKILNEINEKKPDILFVGLGSPRQELWIENNKKILNVKIAMGVGGSFDIYSNTLKRAPIFMQKLGLEWLYRVLQEPKRFKRIFKIPQFIFQVLSTKKE